MSESSLLSALAYLVPAGYALIAAAGLPSERTRQAAVTVFAALGLAVVGYAVTGFALQFGGIGLTHDLPGYEGLIWEWSALGPTWGPGWGMAGLAGWGLTGPAETPAARSLALANLPWVVTAAAIPLAALRGRAPAWASALLGLLTGAVIYPLAGNWVWGGGWLANLSSNLGYGHGLVDLGGAVLVHVLGAAVALAGLVAFWPRRPREAGSELQPAPLPQLYFPVLALLGPVLVLAGIVPWLSANPLLPAGAVDPTRTLLNIVLAAFTGGTASLGYTWLVTGRPDPLMAARGFGAAVVASMALSAFTPAWASLATGAAIGLLTPVAVFVFGHFLRLEEHTATLTVHGLGGATGLLLLGLLADGKAGQGWNGVGGGAYLGMAGQGVTGLLAASPFRPDFPSQLQAQGIGLAAVALLAFFTGWIVIAPPATVLQLLRPRRTSPVSSGEPVLASPGPDPVADSLIPSTPSVMAEGGAVEEEVAAHAILPEPAA
jgi:ammonium transporter, Amt family